MRTNRPTTGTLYKQYFLQMVSRLCFPRARIGGSEVRVVTRICGDGLRVYEECDDGNTASKDGCSKDCTIEEGYRRAPAADGLSLRRTDLLFLGTAG